MLKVSKENQLYIFGCAVLFLSIIAALGQLNKHYSDIFINSDTLGIPHLYNDIVIDNGRISDWYWSSSPSFFPDAFIYFLLAGTLKLSVLKTVFLCGIVEVFIIVSLLTYLFKKIVSKDLQKYKWLIPVFLSMYFIEGFYFSHDPFLSFFLYASGYHKGPFLNSLILICFFLNSSSNTVKYIFICIFSVIASFNDRLYLAMLAVPFILTILFSLKKTEIKHSFISFLCLIIGCFAGMELFNWVAANKLITFIAPHKIYAFDNIIPSLNNFASQMMDYLRSFGFRSFQIIFTFLSIPACLVYYFKNRNSLGQTQLFLLLFYVFFSICTFAAPIINGNYTGIDTIRYNIYPFFFAAIFFASGIGFLLEKKVKISYPVISLSLLIGFTFIISLKINADGFKKYLNYYPENLSEIDSVAGKYNLKKGIGDYWSSRKSTILSKKNIVILSVYEGCNIQELGTNINWYYEGEFDFVLANSISPEALKKFNIRDSITTKNYKILLVDKYIYPKGAYFPETIRK